MKDESSSNTEEPVTGPTYNIVPDPVSERVDLSDLRGVASGDTANKGGVGSDTDLENLAELVPDVKARRRPTNEDASESTAANIVLEGNGGGDVEVVDENLSPVSRKMSMKSGVSNAARRLSVEPHGKVFQADGNSMKVNDTSKQSDNNKKKATTARDQEENEESYAEDATSYDGYPASDEHLDQEKDESKVPSEFMNMASSGQSVSTATQTHEVRMPMYLPTFKPATGCTNASDFIVRCFVARLRSGITVVKHGRSRWCKSRLRILHIHPDGRSLSWKPAEGEPTSSKRPPKLDLSTCLEVRHAWSPDPQNPMYTGTPILRQKCEAANAHKSFALIFKLRTVDITAVTADQCKVLMEGFSALCFRLQVANLAGNNGRGGKKANGAHSRPMPEEDGVSTTASATLTNTSTPRGR